MVFIASTSLFLVVMCGMHVIAVSFQLVSIVRSTFCVVLVGALHTYGWWSSGLEVPMGAGPLFLHAERVAGSCSPPCGGVS